MTNLNQKKSLLIQRLAKLKDEATGDIFLEQECEFIEAKLNSGIYNIVVVGHFSAGKSTFINALMGSNILPSSVKETTAVTTRVHSVNPNHEHVNKAAVHFKNGKVEWIDLQHDQEILKTYATLLEKKLDVASEIEGIDVYKTIPILGDSICLVDTPGDNGMTERIFDVTKKEIEKATAIIYLMPDRGMSATDARLLTYISQFQERVFFVVNRMDNVLEEERESHLNSIAKRIQSIGIMQSTPVIFGISSKEALNGRMDHIQELIQKSGLPALEAAIFEYIEKSEHVEDHFNSVKNALDRLDDDLQKLEKQKKEQLVQTEEKRKQIEARIENIVRRMRLEYDELEQGLLGYMRNETDQIMAVMNDKKVNWVQSTSPSFEAEAFNISKQLKMNLLNMLKKDWKDINLFVMAIKKQITHLNNEINVLANKKFIEFIRVIQIDTLELEKYIPKRNRVVIELILQANKKKTTSPKRFSQLVEAIHGREFHFHVNHQESQLDKKFQSVFRLEESKNNLEKKSKTTGLTLDQVTTEISQKQYEKNSTEKEYKRETSRLGTMPKAEKYYYEEEVSRKGLGKLLDLFTTKTVTRTGYDDSKQKRWIKDKESLERKYNSKIDLLGETISRLQNNQNDLARLKRQQDREIRQLEVQSDTEIIELMEGINVSYHQYTKKCMDEFSRVLNQYATEVHKACTNDLIKDRKEVNEIIKTHVRDRIKKEEVEIRKQHGYLLKEAF